MAQHHNHFLNTDIGIWENGELLFTFPKGTEVYFISSPVSNQGTTNVPTVEVEVVDAYRFTNQLTEDGKYYMIINYSLVDTPDRFR